MPPKSFAIVTFIDFPFTQTKTRENPTTSPGPLVFPAAGVIHMSAEGLGAFAVYGWVNVTSINGTMANDLGGIPA